MSVPAARRQASADADGRGALLWFSNETPDPHGQGGQRRQYFQIAALAESGVRVGAVTLAGEQDSRSLARLPGVEVHRLNLWWRGRRLNVLGWARFRAFLRRHAWRGVAIAHAESWSGGRALADRLGLPMLVDLHNVNSAWLRAQGDEAGAASWAAIERDILEAADTVTVCSPRDLDTLRALGGGRARLAVAAHGIAAEEWAIAPHDPRPVARTFGNWDWLPNARGLDWVLRTVWPQVRAQVPRATLEIAGAGAPGSLPPGVTAVGRVPTVNAFLADAGAVLVPVLQGVGAPVKYLEALASGVPVLATGEGAHGVPLAGALVSDDADAWVTALAGLLADPGAGHDRAGGVRSEVLRRYTWRETSAVLIEWATGERS